jgi:Ca-activated chloride channel family protein
MVSRRRMLALLSASPGLSPALRPALAAPQAEFSTGIKIVSLLVTVRDKSGKFVNELERDDFVVEEDGRPQTISYFSRQYDLPLTLGLLVDTSGSQQDVLGEELTASAAFFEQVLREDVDQAFLERFDERAWLIQNVTVSRAKLAEALGFLENRVRGNPGRGTVLYDAIADSSDLIMKRLQGRKALVLLTDGDDTASRSSLDMAIASCQRADTVAYSVGIGTGLARGGPVLETLARRTGGGYFEVSRKQTVDAIYKTIEEELRSQYNIGYAPPPSAPGKKRAGFHKVRVTVKRNGATAHTRDGYYTS